MAIADRRKPSSDGKLWRLCPFWQSGAAASSSSSSTQNLQSQSLSHQNGAAEANARPSNKVSSVARSLLPARRRLRLDLASNFYFPRKIKGKSFHVRLNKLALAVTMYTIWNERNVRIFKQEQRTVEGCLQVIQQLINHRELS